MNVFENDAVLYINIYYILRNIILYLNLWISYCFKDIILYIINIITISII